MIGCTSAKSAGEAELDADGDGVADDLGAAIDADGDGVTDVFGAGIGVDTDGDGVADAAGLDTDGDGVADALDTDGDGVADEFTSLGSTGTGGAAGSGGAPGSGGASATGGAPGTGGGLVIGGAGGGDSPPDPGNGQPEICDGLDNDDDGIVDDVDAGGDGICDCLAIGTIGTIGPWSDGGNIFAEWLDTRSPIPATALGDTVLTSDALAGLDVIVVLRADTSELQGDPAHHVFGDPEVGALEAWVRAGGGVMTTIGYTGDEAAEIVNVNRLLAPLDAGYSSDLNLGGYITVWTEHPVSNGVSRIFTDNGVTVDATSGTVVALGDGERPAMVVHQVDDGRVIVWGDEWITYDSEWSDTEDQQVELLWLNMVKWLSPPERCQVPIPPILR